MTQKTHNPFQIAAEALSEPYAALARVAVALAWPVTAIVRAYRTRRTVEALESLDARTLRDIGIERAKIDLVARSSVDYPSTDPRVFVNRG